MKDSDHSRFCPQVFRVSGKGFNGLPGGSKQGRVDFFVILGYQLIKNMWQGKDHMIVGHGQQFAFPVQYPVFTVCYLAFGAVPVSAGVIADGLDATAFADGDMSSQVFGPAQGNGLKGLFYLYRRIVLLLKTATMKTDDIGYFIGRLQDSG